MEYLRIRQNKLTNELQSITSPTPRKLQAFIDNINHEAAEALAHCLGVWKQNIVIEAHITPLSEQICKAEFIDALEQSILEVEEM